jgi:hypothetical protein
MNLLLNVRSGPAYHNTADIDSIELIPGGVSVAVTLVTVTSKQAVFQRSGMKCHPLAERRLLFEH